MVKYVTLDEVPDQIRAKLGRYVSNVGGRTFVISGLPPEVTGGVLARYSRAPTGLQTTLVNEFLDENGDPVPAKGTALLERVLIGFGDDSVGELEGVHVGLENISQIGTKWIEDRRIGGSPIEQSTRYVKYDQRDAQGRWRYLRPKEIREVGLEAEFERVTDRAFEVYAEGIKRLQEYIRTTQYPEDKFKITVERDGEKKEIGRSELRGEAEERAFRTNHAFAVRCAALDIGRGVLPASTLTNVGLYGNGRFLTNVLTFMKSSDLDEAQERARELEEELKKVIPTFIQRNKRNERYGLIDREMRRVTRKHLPYIQPTADAVTLVSNAPYIDIVVASSLFPYTNISLEQILGEVKRWPEDKKLDVLETYRGERTSRRDRTGRGLEANYPITFDLVGTFGEFRDLERHRMLTQQRQGLTTDLGFVLPPEMQEIGLEGEVQEVVDKMDALNSRIKRLGLNAASEYATLFNHRVRFMLGMNLREFQHLAELRTGPAGHFGYRAMVMEMARKLITRDPWTERMLEFVDYSDPGNKITRAKERSRIAGKNLAVGISDDSDLD